MAATGSCVAAQGFYSCPKWKLLCSFWAGPLKRGLSFSGACGLFLDLGWSPRLLHWQDDS